MMDEKEKWDRRVALMVSTGIHALLLLALFFLIAWRPPDPPIPEYGIELNFGLDDSGSGELQPTQEMQQSESSDEPMTEDNTETSTVPEPETDHAEVQEDAQPPSEESTDPAEIDTTPTTETDSPVVEQKEPAQKPAVEEQIEPIEKTHVPPKPADEKNEQQTENVNPTEEASIKEPMEPTTEQNDATQQGADTPKTDTNNQSQGVGETDTGDQGDPEGEIDAKALYGGGGSNGFSLSMSGWAWADKPKVPDLGNNEAGRIVFEIECDDEGMIIGIKTLERGISPAAEMKLKNEIRNNSLIRTSGGKVPPRSTGKVIFVIKAQ